MVEIRLSVGGVAHPTSCKSRAELLGFVSLNTNLHEIVFATDIIATRRLAVSLANPNEIGNIFNVGFHCIQHQPTRNRIRN
jgi:hypothetical protein